MKPGDEFELKVTPDRFVTVRYAGASGDFNPIHIDEEFAQQVGLPGRILHGLWTMAQVARAHTDTLGGPDKLARLATIIERVAVDDPARRLKEIAPQPAPLPSRFDIFTVAPRVLIDNRASAGHTVIEVNGRDRKGLLYSLTRELAAQRLQIASAKVSTFGARAVDVFYLKDQFGLKIEDERRLKAIRESLLAVDRMIPFALASAKAWFSADQAEALHVVRDDINSLGHQLNRFSERNRHFRDFTLYSLISTLKEVIDGLVYALLTAGTFGWLWPR